jgi:peptidoglycan/LPS O-acetylase OafA/YrhL
VEVENRLLWWGFPAALILYGFVAVEGILRAPKFLTRIGDASYSLYLTHGIFTYLYGGLLKRGALATSTKQNFAVVFGTLFAILFSFIFYRIVERPLVARLGKKKFLSRTASAM